MLLPICFDRLPVHMVIAVKSARGLPIMDKSISSTDAFVEIHYDDEVWKSEVVTDLNPVWDGAQMTIDSHEKQLAEEALDIRVMDHDTYSANDAVGRIRLDVSLLIAKMRIDKEDNREFNLTMPIYDTLLGVRGELSFSIQLQLLGAASMASYIQFLTGSSVPEGNQIVEVIGLVNELKVEKDPEYEWLDRIRTPRATNEARQTTIRGAMREAAMTVAEKAHKMGANTVLCYREFVDVEGSSSDYMCIRVYGTAVKVEPRRMGTRFVDRVLIPMISIPSIQHQMGNGGIVMARAVHVLDDEDNAEQKRKSWWCNLRSELFQQSSSLGCNLVLGYSEQCTVHDGVAVLSCSGTAVLFGMDSDIERDKENGGESREVRDAGVNIHKSSSSSRRASSVRGLPIDRILMNCSPFHLSFGVDDVPFHVKITKCVLCRKANCSDMILSTSQCPQPPIISPQRHYVQVSVVKRLPKTADREEFATEISNVIPVIDHEVYNSLLAEGRLVNVQGNALFDVRSTVSFSDDLIVIVVTAVLVRLLCIQKDEIVSPSLTSVLSFPALQRNVDARRFSWGSVRDAIRLRPTTLPSIQMKIMHLRAPLMDSLDESSSSKHKRRISLIVDKIKRKQHEKDFISHVVFERQLCTQIGIIDAVAAPNLSSVAGLHPAPSSHSLLLNREQTSGCVPYVRWSEVFIREDCRSLKDSTSIDGFFGSTIDDGISIGRALMQASSGSSLCSFELSSPYFHVGRDSAAAVILLSSDFANSPF